MSKEKLNIDFKAWSYRCADGCCEEGGETLFLNGEELTDYGDDVTNALRSVLEKLGYEVEFNWDYENI